MRQVHPVPGRDLVDGEGPPPHGARRRPPRRPRGDEGRWRQHAVQEFLRAGRWRGLADRLLAEALSGGVRRARQTRWMSPPRATRHRRRGAARDTGLGPGRAGAGADVSDDGLVTLQIDGKELTVPPGTLVIRAAEAIGIEIPRFCDHPYLDPVGACRQCIVEIEGQRKPITACTTPVAEGMVVHTQHTSEEARKAQEGMLEFLLINHPLDCPVCDRGGECPLQDQALAWGPGESRYIDPKRVYEKPIPLSPLVLLDRERCVLCARCTRFCDQISGERFIELFDRGPAEQVAIASGEDFRSPFSGNTVQICPVGALTSSTYRFAARPFDVRM